MKKIPVKFSSLLGKTITSTTGIEKGSGEVSITCSDGTVYEMYHRQDCCEDVEIYEIHGDPGDLEGLVVEAEEVTNADGPEPKGAESYTWTFYKLGTIKGSVTIRWLGQSNGYYSESVSFFRVDP